MYYYSPLEQFEIYNLIIFVNSQVVFFFKNIDLYFILLNIILIMLSINFIYILKLQSTITQSVLEFLYLFIVGLTSRHCNIEGLLFFPIFFLTFMFILFSNILGLAPFSFTLTSQLIIPVTLALTFNLSFFLWGFYFYGTTFLQVFIPRGVPIFLLPLVVIIEIISYLLRSFSLSVRLFANMMAGHTLLYILSSFVVSLSHINIFCALIPILLVVGVSFLEIGIAFLQAYVFVVLLSIYVTDSLHPIH